MKFKRKNGLFYLENEFKLSNNVETKLVDGLIVGKCIGFKDNPETLGHGEVNAISHIVEKVKNINENTLYIKCKILSSGRGEKLLKYIYKNIESHFCKIILSCDNDFETSIKSLKFSLESNYNNRGQLIINRINICK